MGSTEDVDPYLDPETGILRNKVGAETKVALDDAEGDLSFARLMQLMDHPPKATGDLEELPAIHGHLFQDVYEWAGQVRTVEMRKNVEDAEFFLPVSLIDRAAGYAAEELCADNNLRGLDRDSFIDRLAHHYDQFNYIHPFREGNGRAQRVLWNRVARDAGWQLDWRGVHGETNDQASRAAWERRDLGPLREMFSAIVTNATPPAERDASWHAVERARLSFPTPAPPEPHSSARTAHRADHKHAAHMAADTGLEGKDSSGEHHCRLRAREHSRAEPRGAGDRVARRRRSARLRRLWRVESHR